jgi:histidine ammonia-lyase
VSRVKADARSRGSAPGSPGAPVTLGGEPLTLAELQALMRGAAAVLAESARDRIHSSRDLIDRAARGDRAVYGVNTGFGALKSVRIPESDVDRLQVNLVRSHAAGAGPELEPAAVRLMLALRAHSLSLGASGVREELIRHLIAMLERDLLPVVPSRGSLGASGDLIPLAHLALAVIGEGEIRRGGRAAPASEHYAEAALPPVRLTAKEGLALINGTQAATAVGLLALLEFMEVLRAAHAACALSVEAICGSSRPFDARVHAVRPHEGQVESAAAIRELLDGSPILASHEDCRKVQDPYSFRCAPQVLGASIDAMRYARRALLTEVNSVTDNPLVFADSGEVLSAGNFHGQPVAMALDFLAIGMAEVGSIAERRTFLLLDSEKSGLPPFLCRGAGLGSGLMMVQYLQAALVSENRMLAHPACTDTVPTSAGQEDHVSMAMHAAVKALTLVRNVRRIVAGELLCAAQGIEFLRPLRTSSRLEALHRGIRERVPELTEDRRQDHDLAALDAWIEAGGAAASAQVAEF